MKEYETVVERFIWPIFFTESYSETLIHKYPQLYLVTVHTFLTFLISKLIFRQMVKVFCFSLRKQECDWVVPLTEYRKIVRTLSRGNLALVINTNGWESLGCFGKRGKKEKPWKALLFSTKFPLGYFQVNSQQNYRGFSHKIGKRCWWNYYSFQTVVNA